MCEKKNKRQKPIDESYFEHGERSERNSHFSVEPSAENDFDIELMTGHKIEGTDKK